MWPAFIIQHLEPLLPHGFIAEPRARLGSHYEIDIGTFGPDQDRGWDADSGGGTATSVAPWAPPRPSVAEDDEGHPYEYAAHIYRPGGPCEPDRVLVASIELVSPGNKDRPAARAALASKCVDLVRKNVCVSLVDLVGTMRHNLYADVLDLMGKADPTFSLTPPAMYAATVRRVPNGVRYRLESWGFRMAVGERLPSLPIYLTETSGLTLDLEASYEDVCRILRLP